jgi:hypothetical protein
MKWLGNECAEQEVTGSRASGLEALVFRVKNGATCDFDGAGGWLSGGVSPEIKFFFYFSACFLVFPENHIIAGLPLAVQNLAVVRVFEPAVMKRSRVVTFFYDCCPDALLLYTSVVCYSILYF